MNKDKKLVLRLTQYELEKLKEFANHKDVTMSHVLREYIRRLPKPPSVETPIAWGNEREGGRGIRLIVQS